HENAVGVRGAHVLHEALVDLDDVDGKIAQIGQPGMAGAEIVEPDADAHLFQHGEIGDLSGAAVHQQALGDLDGDVGRRTARTDNRLAHHVDEFRALQL